MVKTLEPLLESISVSTIKGPIFLQYSQSKYYSCEASCDSGCYSSCERCFDCFSTR